MMAIPLKCVCDSKVAGAGYLMLILNKALTVDASKQTHRQGPLQYAAQLSAQCN